MLIIYAHPNKLGHCGYILKLIENNLKKHKLKYEILDLYKINYDPVLKPKEHYTSGNRAVSSENLIIQDKIIANEKMIIIYPTWWNGVPAILKGFFDRIFTSGYAFKYINGIPRGLLKDKKAAVITTTGAPYLIYRFFLSQRSLKTVVDDTLKFCGIKAKGFSVNSSLNLNEKQKIKIQNTTDDLLKYIRAH